MPTRIRARVLLLTQATYTVGVSAVVSDDLGDVLLLRNRYRSSSSWQLPGGFVSRGETLEAAIAREVREETGLEVSITRQLLARIARPQHLDVCFLCSITAGELHVDRREIIDGRFFSSQSLPSDIPTDQLELISVAATYS